jgi:hypothetical protein
MLGEQYADLKGKTAGQKILGIEDPTIERSVSASGTMKGISLQEMITNHGVLCSTPGGVQVPLSTCGCGRYVRINRLNE